MNDQIKIDFLKAAISDAQELIRFTDNKTALATTVVGALIVGVFSIVENTVRYFYYWPFIFWILYLFTAIGIVICLWIIARIIKPTENPLGNINLSDKNKTTVPFYLAPNTYSKDNNLGYVFANSNTYKLANSVDTYIDALNAATEQEIVKSLTIELHKVSFIRNIKNDRFHALVKVVLLTTLIFIAMIVCYHFKLQMFSSCNCAR